MSLIGALARLNLGSRVQSIRGLKTSAVLFAEPLKKKKKMDPSVIKAREDRKRKKLEKQIRRLERNARQLKPIEECEPSIGVIDNRTGRLRTYEAISSEMEEARSLLEKSWAAYKRDQHMSDVQLLDRIVFSQQKALDELRKESEELYQEAIQLDLVLLPFSSEGPSNTPQIENYEAPDGDYLDTSRKW